MSHQPPTGDMTRDIQHALDATPLRNGLWAVRPVNQLGTCGWYPYAWQVQYVKAKTASAAIAKVQR